MKLFNNNKCITNRENNSVILQHWYSATLAAMPALLSGCMGIYESGFECPAGTGVGCKSISEVNAMVNSGELPKAHPERALESEEYRAKCTTCDQSSRLNQEKPEIWINPFYFKSLQKQHQEELQKEKQEIYQLRAGHDKISL